MQMLNRFKIGVRLGAAFALVLALLCAVAGIGALQIKAMDNRVDDFAENLMPSLRVVNKLQTEFIELRRLEAQHLLMTTEKDLVEMEGRIDKLRSGLQASLKDYEALVSDAEDRSNLKAAESAIAAYQTHNKAQLGLNRAGVGDVGKHDEAKKYMFGESRQVYQAGIAAIKAIWAYNEKLGKDAATQASATYDKALLWMGVAAAIGLALGAACALLIARSITVPMAQAVAVADRIGAGDLTARVNVEGNDETARLLDALKRMNENLVGIVGRVRNSADSIATGSTQIATGNADLSQRTEEQASNLQQTAASMEELQATVKNNADTARQASQLADSASTVAGEGGAAVDRVVQTMEQISTASRRIADIIGVIDGIAFQTNILALNAAVEAARAGEQGRGFAVVASEVRTLAQRSANAAREIKQLIGESVEKVETGSRLCGEAGQTMGDIVSQVKRVADLIGEITSASAEQSQGIGQIGQAVSQLDQVTQQNAALVEESAAAAESLKHQAAELATTVAQFRLEHSA